MHHIEESQAPMIVGRLSYRAVTSRLGSLGILWCVWMRDLHE